MIIISHPTGNANVRAAVNGFADANLLKAFYTSIAAFEGSSLYKLGAFKLFTEIRRRQFDKKVQVFTHTNPWLEVGRLLALKIGSSSLLKHETGTLSVDAIYRYQDSFVAKQIQSQSRQKIKGVYCYEDGAALTFKRAKKLGITTFYDLPIGYWRSARKLMEHEQKRWPEWKETLSGFKDSDDKLNRKDEELKLADAIFVASSFTAKTLQDFPGKLTKVQVIPYGFPYIKEKKDYIGILNRKKIKLLFVGGLSQRKGIADLFSAIKDLKDYVELTVVGKKNTDECRVLNESLKEYKWISSLPNEDVLQLMRQHDVLVFPSLFEGFGLVITEAMSQGIPVITTDRTAGPDLIEHGRNGWLVEAGSTMALKQAIEHFIQYPNQISELGREAQETARKRPWIVYGNELASAVAKTINN